MQYDISKYRFSDLVDMPAFARMMESFFNATGIPNGLVDANGELLTLSAGKNACTEFHRAQPESAERCRASNLAMMNELHNGCIAGGLCQNGLMDYATPVVIEGRQLATLFLGQVLHEKPDMTFFRAQGEKFGFDPVAYEKSIQAIAVVNQDRLQKLMAVMVEMAQMLAASGLARIRQTVLEQDLDRSTERRIQLEDILDSSPVAIGWSDENGRIEYINRQFTRLFGYSLDEIPDLETWYQLAYPDIHYRETTILAWIREVALAHQTGVTPPELESDVTCKNGSVRRVVIRASWVGNRRLINFSDISDRWASEQRMRAHDTMLEMVARGVMLGNILTAIVQQVQTEDPSALCSILLLDAEGKHLLNGAAPDLPAFYNAAISGIEIGMGIGSCGTAAYLGQRVIVEDIQTHEYWKPYVGLAQKAGLGSCWSEPILSTQGKVLGTFAIYHAEAKEPQPKDIERIGYAANLAALAIESNYAREELERRAYSDYLTGLSNRRHFFEQAEKEMMRAQRYNGRLSLAMLDVDRFKQTNDTYGHEVGDLVLKKLAAVCHASLRDVDIVGRIGGEEFAILLPETGATQAIEAAERLRVSLADAPVTLSNGEPLHFTVSIGVAMLNGKNSNIDMLLSQADQALYQAKNAGRNKVCMHQAVPA